MPKFEINYDPSLNATAGYLTITDDKDNPITFPNDKRLLVLLFKLLYTFEGREMMRNNKPLKGVLAPANEKNLRDYFSKNGVTDLAVQNALVNAHVAAQKWADDFKAGPAYDQDRMDSEKVYLQNMSFITWSLLEDAKGHEYSMGW
jgi:hypothetical protein